MVESSKEEPVSPSMEPLEVRATQMSNLRWEIKTQKK